MTGLVRVLTDSAASLPPATAAALGVTVVPMTLVLGGTVYTDGSVEPHELAERAAAESVSTSAPSPGDYVTALEAAGAEGGALVATVSSKMSASFESATTAASYLPPGTVRVVDTATAAGAQGLVVLAAARAAAAGAELEAVERAAGEVVGRVRLLAALEDLDHLARSGRVPGLAAKAGRTLGVRPLFEFRHGTAHPMRPALSVDAAVARIVETCRRDGRPGGRLRAAVLDAEGGEAARTLLQAVCDEVGGEQVAEAFVAPFSSVMVAHTGTGLFGLGWWWDPDAA